MLNFIANTCISIFNLKPDGSVVGRPIVCSLCQIRENFYTIPNMSFMYKFLVKVYFEKEWMKSTLYIK